jgi:RNA polymerase sigma factor (sigma-70 family)
MRAIAEKSRTNELNGCLARLVRYARYLCGQRPDDAEDLVQTAVSEWLAKPVNELPVFVQLRQIIKSRYVDMIRAKENGNVQLAEDDVYPTCGDLDMVVAVREVLERLPYEERYVLWSVYGQGFSVDEVAVEMRVDPRTVKRRLATARRMFAAIYGQV